MHVTVAGGGLAGMIAALRLAERGFAVDLYEASHRLGGKAGADHNNPDFDEHGYHIFPMWYRNIWKLVDELGIGENFADVEDFLQLERGAYPAFKKLTNLGSARHLFKNLLSGVLPFEEMALFFYSTLDLMSHRLSYRRFLDQTSVNGFVRGRFYRTERIALQHQDLLLKGISVPSYAVSAMTMRNVLRFWFRYPLPMHRILLGNLHTMWIQPIEQRLVKLGVRIHCGRRLEKIETDGRRVTSVRLSGGGEQGATSAAVPVDRLIVAIPWEALAKLLDDALFRSAPGLFHIQGLNSAAMAALNIYCNRRIPGMPKDHVNLIGGKYGLSFVDVGQWWPEYQGRRTVLNAISSNFQSLELVSPEIAQKELLAEMLEFLPELKPEDITRVWFTPHTAEPLFMNEVGNWKYRPRARTELPNLYLAGDYCRTHIDLVCMEGAVSSALLAAEALRSDTATGAPIELLEPDTYPTWVLWLLWLFGLPVAALLKLISMLRQLRR